jgi:hypothetical protein
MSQEAEEVTFSKVKRNGLVAKKKMPVFHHGGWRTFLLWILKLLDHTQFMGYTPNALDQEDFIEDVQLLLEGEDLRVFRSRWTRRSLALRQSWPLCERSRRTTARQALVRSS